MLRITRIAQSPLEFTLKVQGRIVSEWIDVLEQETMSLIEAGRTVRLDFSEVTFVSRRGQAMLRRLPAGRLRIVNCSPLIEQALGEQCQPCGPGDN